MRVTRITLLFVLYCLSVAMDVHAQKLTLRFLSLEPDLNAPLTARNEEFKKTDINGDLYAIIKVVGDDPNVDMSKFTFDFALNHEICANAPSDECWLYVRRNSKKVTIKRENYVSISNQDLGVIIEAGKTYIMNLSVQAPVVERRVLQFQITPANEGAEVWVKPEGSNDEYQKWGALDNKGSVNQRLITGTYLYEIRHNDYETSQGRVRLFPDKEALVEKVTLTPKYGWLVVKDDNGIAGADVYVNNEKIGKVPYSEKRRWTEGEYRIVISNGELYKTYSSTFIIRRNETTTLSPKLESNAGMTTIKVDGDAAIFIDGTRMGSSSWTGPLKAGVYDVECRLAGHRPTKKQITVRSNEAETFIMDKPTPLVGSISVRSNPAGAMVLLDGKDTGMKTPCTINNVLQGSHTVSVSMSNRRTETRKIELWEGDDEKVNVTLSDIATMTITSQPSGAELYINGEYRARTPYSAEMSSGDYKIRLVQHGYSEVNKKVHLDSSSPAKNFKLHRLIQKTSGFYLQPAFQIGNSMQYGLLLGGYIHNFNIEAGVLTGFGLTGYYADNRRIYWNSFDGRGGDIEELFPTTTIAAHFGYGIAIGTRLRITPQLGSNYVQYQSWDGGGSKFNVLSFTMGGRVDYAVARHFGLSLIPEYDIPINKSETYQYFLDNGIKDFVKGFNIKIGFNFFF